jgi:glycosyltransferase involved in cell wall biosynthesis
VARLRAAFLERRRAMGLEETVLVLDHREDVAALLAAFDVLAFPSDHEPFGMAVLEAMAAGCPVVASDSGGPREILEDGRGGVLVPTGDAPALASALLRVLADPALAGRLAEEAQQRVRAEFHRERYARDIQELYARLA